MDGGASPVVCYRIEASTMRSRAAILFIATSLQAVLAAGETRSPSQALLEDTCQSCHNDVSLVGNMSLDGFDLSEPEGRAELAESVIRKLRAGMMPPAGMPSATSAFLTFPARRVESRLL